MRERRDVLEGVYGAQYPSTGAPLHRDYQLLAAIADRAVELASRGLQGSTPARSRTSGIPSTSRRTSAGTGSTRWPTSSFKTERLRLLYVSTRRSQKICEAVLAHRMSQRLIAEGAPAGEVLKYLDKAMEAAKENQRIYCINYDDDYDWTDGLCSRVVDELERMRRQFIASISTDTKVAAGVDVRQARRS